MYTCKSAFSMFAALAFAALVSAAHAQSLSSSSGVSAANLTTGNTGYYLSYNGNNTGAPTSTSSTTLFSGMDSHGAMQTMTLTGTASSSAQYGRLHGSSDLTITNPYYNAGNPIYYNSHTNTLNPAGSPDTLGAGAIAGFTDTLQFGGELEAGYQARYLFHLDGTTTGRGGGAFLSAAIGSDPADTFYTSSLGSIAVDWATQDHSINGIVPQSINVLFIPQVNADLMNIPEGQTYTGSADFSATLTLTGIELLDANGNLASGWTVTAASGTNYPLIMGQAVPEPGSIALLIGMGVTGIGFLRRRTRSR